MASLPAEVFEKRYFFEERGVEVHVVLLPEPFGDVLQKLILLVVMENLFNVIVLLQAGLYSHLKIMGNGILKCHPPESGDLPVPISEVAHNGGQGDKIGHFADEVADQLQEHHTERRPEGGGSDVSEADPDGEGVRPVEPVGVYDEP